MLKRLLIWLLVLGIWETAYRTVGWKPWIFPAPSHVLDAMLGMLNIRTTFGDAVSSPNWPIAAQTDDGSILKSPLVEAQIVSFIRLIIRFFTSVLLGLVLGLLMWRFKSIDDFVGPLFLGLQTLPSVCWVPLAILLFGINERGIMFVLVMGSFFAIAISLRDGLRTIPPIYRRAGRMLGARGWRMYRYVLLPASLPAMSSSLRSGFSFAWRSLMGAELIFVVRNRGVGFLLAIGRDFSDVAQVVAVLIVMVLIGMAFDRFAFAAIERRIYARFGLSHR